MQRQRQRPGPQRGVEHPGAEPPRGVRQQLSRAHRAGLREPRDQAGQRVVRHREQDEVGPGQHLGGFDQRHAGQQGGGAAQGGVGDARGGDRPVPCQAQRGGQRGADPSGADDSYGQAGGTVLHPCGLVSGIVDWVHAVAAFRSSPLGYRTRSRQCYANDFRVLWGISNGLRPGRCARITRMSDRDDGGFEAAVDPEAAVEAPAAAADPADAAGEAARTKARRRAAVAGCDRILSHQRAATLGERLARLTDEAAGAYDLSGPIDHYGDGVVADLERRVAGLLGTDDAAFFPSGTMAQQVALRCWAGRTGNPAVALHPLAHPEVHERGALSALSGLRPVHPTTAPRLPTAAEVRDFEEPFGTLMLELPLRDAGFVLPSWQELTEVVAAARERDAVVHFDGARLWECPPHFGRPLAEIAELADSVYVSFYKSLDGLSGAALAGPADFVEEARTWRHRYGGQIFQQWPAALAALAGLDNALPRLPSCVAHARTVAEALTEALAAAPFFRVHPAVPHTHQFQVWLPYPADVLNEAGLRQAEEDKVFLFSGWYPSGPPGLSMTEVTVDSDALEWTAERIREAVAGFLARLP